MHKIFILFILSFTITGFLVAYGESNNEDLKTANVSNDPSSSNLFEYVFSQYEVGVKFKDVLPVAIGILLFSYFIWKTSSILSKREVLDMFLKWPTDNYHQDEVLLIASFFSASRTPGDRWAGGTKDSATASEPTVQMVILTPIK